MLKLMDIFMPQIFGCLDLFTCHSKLCQSVTRLQLMVFTGFIQGGLIKIEGLFKTIIQFLRT